LPRGQNTYQRTLFWQTNANAWMFWLKIVILVFFVVVVVVVGIHIDARRLTKVVHGRSRPDRTADYSRETYGQCVRIPVVIVEPAA